MFPVYLDLGYFLAGLWTLMPRVLSAGLLPPPGTLEELERAFLRGYFDSEPVPRPQIRLYEVQTLLARWASAVHGRRSPAGHAHRRKPMFPARRGLIRRCVQRSLDAFGAEGRREPSA